MNAGDYTPTVLRVAVAEDVHFDTLFSFTSAQWPTRPSHGLLGSSPALPAHPNLKTISAPVCWYSVGVNGSGLSGSDGPF